MKIFSVKLEARVNLLTLKNRRYSNKLEQDFKSALSLVRNITLKGTGFETQSMKQENYSNIIRYFRNRLKREYENATN